MTADATRTYLVEGHPEKILQVSPRAFPNVVRDAAQKAETARTALGEQLGWAVATALEQWETNGVSCALFECLRPVSSSRMQRFLQLRKITPPVLDWLSEVTKLSREANKNAETYLRGLADCPFDPLREAAEQALQRLDRGTFAPRAVVMHSDFWIGNILFDPSGARQFMVIDWRGSKIDGMPIFDLVRLAESAKLSRKTLHHELAAHAEILCCPLQDTRSYLLAALGSIWLSLDQFPPERFAAMAIRNLRTVDAALHT